MLPYVPVFRTIPDIFQNITKIMGVHQLFLCLGGNLGNKFEIFSETRNLIEKRIGPFIHASRIYASPAWGFEASGEFWNQVTMVATNLSPLAVLWKCKKIEDYFGRERIPGHYLSRKMDIDLLFYDNQVTDSQTLTLPHPLIAVRRFVLVPLAEIAPEMIHPVTGKTVAEMLYECPDPSPVNPAGNLATGNNLQ